MRWLWRLCLWFCRHGYHDYAPGKRCGQCGMPKAVEMDARRRARRLGLSGERFNAYVYGTLRKTGWRPPRARRRRLPGLGPG